MNSIWYHRIPFFCFALSSAQMRIRGGHWIRSAVLSPCSICMGTLTVNFASQPFRWFALVKLLWSLIDTLSVALLILYKQKRWANNVPWILLRLISSAFSNREGDPNVLLLHANCISLYYISYFFIGIHPLFWSLLIFIVLQITYVISAKIVTIYKILDSEGYSVVPLICFNYLLYRFIFIFFADDKYCHYICKICNWCN